MSAPTLTDMQAAGFPVGGEALAVDFADTLITVTDPVTDLLADPDRAAAWWRLQAGRLPVPTTVPPATPTRRLRTAVRAALQACADGQAIPVAAVDDINAAAASSPTSFRLVQLAGRLVRDVRWHDEYGGHPALAAIARSAVDLLGEPETIRRLRRCANPACSMLFVADNSRRIWCTANICGNRARVARHYASRRRDAEPPSGSAVR